jgi:LacI family transcriptional regulator
MATVSRVLNGVANKASPATAERVRSAVAELGYRPMSAGRSLRRRQSHLVAVLAANLANPAMTAMAASAEVALRQAGYVMVLCDTHDRPELQDEYLLEMRAQYACGIVLLGAVASPALKAFASASDEVPLVFVNRRNPRGSGGRHVGIDNRQAGVDVARWFHAQGWKRVALIHGRMFSSATADRVGGFCAEAKTLRLLLPASRVLTVRNAEHLHIGHQSMGRLLEGTTRPDAVFCTSDLIAYGAQRRSAEAGLVAGRDIHFAGFDDSPLNEWVAPWLNAVRVPYAEYGAAIVRALQGDSADIVLPHELVVRGTSTAAERREH